MPGFYASVVGGTVLLLLVLVGVWLTWLSLREDTHTPVPLRPDESD
ncbi:MAG: hypothetical protein ABEJ92_03610 [Halobacteriales archaeon]